MAYLILVRHAKSAWNDLGLWTGWAKEDPGLSPEGRAEATRAADAIRDIPLHKTYVSPFKRTVETLDLIKTALDLSALPTETHEALKERDYGVYTGKNKWQVKEAVGEETFQKIRRSWSHPIPGGETLKDVHARVVPFYRTRVAEDLRRGHNILIVAHGNSLRALVKHLENISDEEIGDLEIGVAEALVYRFGENGAIVSKEIRAQNENRGKI